MTPAHAHRVLDGLPAGALEDAAALATVAVAAAGAAGLDATEAPLVRCWPRGATIAVFGRLGHLVLQTLPDARTCSVDVLALAPARADRAAEVVVRRLGRSA